MSAPPTGGAANPEQAPARPPEPRGLAFRLSAYYWCHFGMVGVLMPFWPVFLQSRGMDDASIGILLALPFWLKPVTGPAVARLADRAGMAKPPIVVLVGLTMGAYGLFWIVDGFWLVAAAVLLVALCFQPVLPLMDSLTFRAVRLFSVGVDGAERRGIDYGRLRLWGSVAFICASAGGGYLLEHRPPQVILVAVMALLLCCLFAALALPDLRTSREAARSGSLRVLVRDPRFIVFLVAAGLINGGHAVYYAFGTLYWRAQGIDDVVIGLLWAEGVVAEIILFAYARPVLNRLGPLGMLLLAGAAGAVRWGVTAETLDLAWLFLAQALHAFTFGAMNVGAVNYIDRAAPPGLSATAQSLYSAIPGGLALAGAIPLAGWLYGTEGAGAYWYMAALAGGGAVLALMLAWLPPRDAAAR